ncbi:GAF domain-containing protein [Dactylosporangium aurantiacum]|uniref:GAF domain-containing protein n=1 Tax=Dactylosporangium aurantiacum TaxID=35754 RepID=A0A9Q9MIY2_9ACTN|nr:GAF domain-containing protein [Dactylosporangium aurantiacum]MDG6107088.1 GAF domain-containing protein [Dactylosporangium aurantiacum]UWZ51387.1 GAF domain-containing protein [Dactylosporangium aurantiacum]
MCPIAVRDEGIRSYAGAPLVSAGGHVLGGLCVLDVRPHDFDDTTLDLLRDRAARVVALLGRD